MKKYGIWIAIGVLAALACLLYFAPSLGLTGGKLPAGPEPTEEPPMAEIELKGERELTLEYGEPFEDPGAEAWLIGDDGVRTPLRVETSSFDPEQLGISVVHYYAEQDGVTLCSVSRRITVRDSAAPEITLLGEPGERDYTAVDNHDGDISDRVERVEEEDRIVYTVRDESGNEARAERPKDPVLVFVGGERTQIPADYRFVDPGFLAVDMYGRDLSERVEIEGEVTPWHLGEYTLSYTVTDDFGRTVSAERVIEVVQAEMPETVVQEKVIYLTFDDGPAEPTEALLDMLAKYDAKVTFFVTYSDPRYVDMIGRAYREGHSIGLHGYAHNASLIYASEEDYFDYFDKMQEIIYEQTGEYTRIVRFVGGSSNSASIGICEGIMSRLAEDLTNMGYRYYDWNVQPENAECDVSAAFQNIAGNAQRICAEGETVPISLQHDPGGWNRLVVERVIQWGLENGYTFKGIDLTTPEVHHRICN